jgi:hypothetical protein
MTTNRLATLGVWVAVLTVFFVIVPTTFDWLSRGTPPFLTFFFGSRSFIDWILHIFGLVVLFSITVGMVWIMAKVALSAERRSVGWTKSITGPNGKVLFFILIVLWVGFMAYLASLGLTHLQGGGIALIMLFLGFFLFMGFIWSVIGE